MIGIIISPDRRKEKIVNAIEEKQIEYCFIDIFGHDWNEEVLDEVEGILLYPPASSSLWKVTFFRRVRYLVEKYDVVTSPSLNSVELYETKTAMYDYMEINNIPHPNTKIYYNYKDIKKGISKKKFPLIIKADGGSGASNIKKINKKNQYLNIINKVFFMNYNYKSFTAVKSKFTNSVYRYINFIKRNNGYIIPKDEFFSSYIIEQEMINIKYEWRVIFINDSFFIHGKGENKDGFHSGSKMKIWNFEDFKVLDFAKHILEKNNLYDISIDIFEDDVGDLYVNEIQCIFGTSLEYQMKVAGKQGRYIYDEKWIFEKGDFCRNGCNNLRIESVINKVNEKRLEGGLD